MLTQARLKELFHYEPETGAFTRLVCTGSRGGRGLVSGGFDAAGYPRIGIDGVRHRCHTLAVLYMTGDFPPKGYEPDHIDRDKGNTRWANLRLRTHQQNGFNLPVFKSNTSGFKGVSWDKRARKFVARITQDGRYRFLGNFETAEAALWAYERASETRDREGHSYAG